MKSYKYFVVSPVDYRDGFGKPVTYAKRLYNCDEVEEFCRDELCSAEHGRCLIYKMSDIAASARSHGLSRMYTCGDILQFLDLYDAPGRLIYDVRARSFYEVCR